MKFFVSRFFIDILKTILFLIIGISIKLLKFSKNLYILPKREKNSNTIDIFIINNQSQEHEIPSNNLNFIIKLFKNNPKIFFLFSNESKKKRIEFIKIKFVNFSRFEYLRELIETINFNNILFRKKNIRTKLIRIFL